MAFEEISKGVVKRTERRVLGLFIDGTGLDRATRRIKRRVDIASLVKGVTSGIKPAVARYYTLIPYEDDSRQRAFLDAVSRSGLDVMVKRLPPKGITRQVSVDTFMAADIIAFARGFQDFSAVSAAHSLFASDQPQNAKGGAASASKLPFAKMKAAQKAAAEVENIDGLEVHHIDIDKAAEALESDAPKARPAKRESSSSARKEKRIITVVCPSRELAYPMSLVREFGVDTISADFGEFNTGDVLKSAAKWIDLSDSESIWRD